MWVFQKDVPSENTWNNGPLYYSYSKPEKKMTTGFGNQIDNIDTALRLCAMLFMYDQS